MIVKAFRSENLPHTFYKLFVISICLISLWITRNTTIDDAFISWREGYNFLHHGRFTFNPSGDLSNGATSTAFGLIALIPVFLNVDIVLFFKIVSIITILGYCLIATKVKTSTNKFTFLLLSLGTLTFGIHLWGGLETSISVLLTTILIVYARHNLTKFKLFCYCLCAFLLIWVRMDLLLFVLGIAIARISYFENSFRWNFEFLLNLGKRFFGDKLLWISFLSLFSQLIFLRIFSGNFLPTSVLRKSFSNSNPLSFVVTNSYSLFLWIAIATLAISFCAKGGDKRFLAILSATVISSLGFIYLVSDLQMNFSGRFGYMLTWPIVLASIYFNNGNKMLRPARHVAIWLIITVNLSYAEASQLVTFYSRLQNAQARIGLSTAINPTKTFLIGGDAGIISYMAPDAIFQDTNGLVSSRPSSETLDRDTKFGKSPLIVVLVTPSAKLENFMQNQEFLYRWVTKNNLIYLGYMKWDVGYYNQIWASSSIGKKRIADLGLQIIKSAEQEVSSSSLRFKSDQSLNWWLPKRETKAP